MTRLVSTREEIDALRAEAWSWMGTPFSPRQMVKGAAVDCVHLPLGILRGVGGRFENPFPDGYTVDRSKHRSDSLVLAWLESAAPEVQRIARITRFEQEEDIKRRQAEISAIGLQPGDVVTFQLNLCVDHIGLMLNEGDLIHCVHPQGVNLGAIEDPTFAQTLHSVWRPYRLEPAQSCVLQPDQIAEFLRTKR